MPRRTTASRSRWSAAALVVGLAVLSGCNGRAGSGLWQRDLDPVVLTGAQVPHLMGADPGSIVAFRWNSETRRWEQVPVQVDERHVEYLTKLRNGTGSSGPTTLAYSDPTDNAGPDPVSTLDADDEIAFMARDTGGPAPRGTGDPSGVLASSGDRVVVTDPLASYDPVRGAGLGYVYLFRRASAALSPSAGKDYVTYTFAPNDPMGHSESSTVSSDRYSTHFSARWTRDQVTIGSGPDILDRHRNLFAVGNCVRSEDTFSAGDGGYATNIDGPIRAIRSYLGANSGTYTQREHLFYRGAEQVRTFLRVHAIPGILDFYDLSAAAVGMQYASSSTPGGVTVDGVPDTTGTAAPTWEAVTGAQGALVSTTSMTTDIAGLAVQAYYLDDATPPAVQCTGDSSEYGAAGTAITSSIPNTDPTAISFNTLTATRWNVFVPSPAAPDVPALVANLGAPVTTSVSAFVPGA
ncbi:MAG: hypothetical protein ACT4OV_12060 [Microthrixaceae bacterium]